MGAPVIVGLGAHEMEGEGATEIVGVGSSEKEGWAAESRELGGEGGLECLLLSSLAFDVSSLPSFLENSATMVLLFGNCSLWHSG